MSPHVGVLALQGDTREHLAALREAGAEVSTVRRLTELNAVDALVIPGGESTAMSHLLREHELLEPLRDRLAAGMPCYGSCAGMILLAERLENDDSVYFGALHATVRRNAYGRQLGSFSATGSFGDITDMPSPTSAGVFGMARTSR